MKQRSLYAAFWYSCLFELVYCVCLCDWPSLSSLRYGFLRLLLLQQGIYDVPLGVFVCDRIENIISSITCVLNSKLFVVLCFDCVDCYSLYVAI
jgi:hypothetical protein